MIQPMVTELTLEMASGVLLAAVEKARSVGVRVNVAVVDAGPHLLAFCRMDGALPGAIDIAIRKARTARLFEMESGAVGELSQPEGSCMGSSIPTAA